MNRRHATLKVALAVTVAVVGASIGCSSSTGPNGPAPLAANDLGVASLDVQQHDANGLSMRGLDKDGKEVMSVKLTVGMIDYVPDEGMDPVRLDGREVVIVGSDGLMSKHQDAFRTPTAIKEPIGGTAGKFVAIPEVAAAIKEYGLTFISRKATLAASTYVAVPPQAIDFSSSSPALNNVCTTVDSATGGTGSLWDIMCSDKNGNTHASERVFTGICDSNASPSGFHPVWNSVMVSGSSQITGTPPYSNVYPCIMYSTDGDNTNGGGCGWDLWLSSTNHDIYPNAYSTETSSYGAEGRTWGSVSGTCTCTHCSGTQPLDANNNPCSCRTSATSPTNLRANSTACKLDEECQHNANQAGDCVSGTCQSPAGGGCGTSSPTNGGRCADAVSIDLDLNCTQTINGTTVSQPNFSTYCGTNVPGQVMEVWTNSSSYQCFTIGASSGFSLGAVNSSCGSNNSCSTSYSSCVAAGSPLYFVAQKNGGGSGTFTVTVTPN